LILERCFNAIAWAVQEILLEVYVKRVGPNYTHISHSCSPESFVSSHKLVNHAGSRFAIVVKRQNPLKPPAARPVYGLVESTRNAFIALIQDY